MNLNAKYDVFVSYSRKDYVDESKNPIAGSAVAALLDFLDKNGITYWFDKEGIYSGSEFVEVITDAITDSKMMIFVSSEHSNASPWTTGEIFEALEQEKLIVPFKIDNSLYNKKYRMMVRPLDFIEYFTNPDVAFESLLKTINVCKEEYAHAVAEEEKRKAEETAKQRRAEIIEEIKTESFDFHRHASTLAQDAQILVEKQKLVGNVEKKCPVCSSMQPIENSFCNKCGWTFTPVFDAHPEGDKDHLFVMRSLWNAVRDSDTIRINLENKIQELEPLQKEKDTLMATIQSLQQQLEVTKADAQRILENARTTEAQWRNEVDSVNLQLTAANATLAEKERIIASLEITISNNEAKFRNIQKELREYKDADTKRKAAEDALKKAETERKPLVEKKRGIYVGNVGFKMIHVEGGTFTMGATPEMANSYAVEGPPHKVTLSSYYIGEIPVTQELWEAVMGTNPSFFKGDNLPVEHVSWWDCQNFIKKLNAKTGKKFRLPTEAEWEYAARGGNKSMHTQYSGSNKLDEVAWNGRNSENKTHPVRRRKPNELGIYDMSGNVWEWCQDWFGYYGSRDLLNPTGPDNGNYRVSRGGSYKDIDHCRMSCRSNFYQESYSDMCHGLRLTLSEL